MVINISLAALQNVIMQWQRHGVESGGGGCKGDRALSEDIFLNQEKFEILSKCCDVLI